MVDKILRERVDDILDVGRAVRAGSRAYIHPYGLGVPAGAALWRLACSVAGAVAVVLCCHLLHVERVCCLCVCVAATGWVRPLGWAS